MGTKFTPLREGWGSPLAALDRENGDRKRRPVEMAWHYFAGFSGMGGRFNSLCSEVTFPSDAQLHENIPHSAAIICSVCKERKDLADHLGSESAGT